MANTVPVLREAIDADVERITPLFLKSVDTSIPGITFSTDPNYAAELIIPALRARLSPPRALKTYVLELPSGQLVAYGCVKAWEDDNVDSDTGADVELDMFFVHAELGGRGYGSLLMKAIQEKWKHGMWLYVFKKNTHAIGFYQNWGFEVVEGREKVLDLHLSYPAQEVAVLMRWRGGE